MQPEPLQQTGHLAAAFVPQEAAERLVLQAADVEFASGDDAEQGFVAGIEEIEAGAGPALLADRLLQLAEFAAAVAGILNRGQKLQAAAVGSLQHARAGRASCRWFSASAPAWFPGCHRDVLPRGSA